MRGKKQAKGRRQPASKKADELNERELDQATGGVARQDGASVAPDQSVDPNLGLQEKMQRENVVFTSVSNVLKTRHDTAKSSIGNG